MTTTDLHPVGHPQAQRSTRHLASGAKLERPKTAGEIEREAEERVEKEALLSSLAAEAAEDED